MLTAVKPNTSADQFPLRDGFRLVRFSANFSGRNGQ
jgi:hypothetical protein